MTTPCAQSCEQRGDGHHRGDADDDTEHGEQRAELVVHTAPIAICMFSVGVIFIGYSDLRATIGSSFAAREAGYQPDDDSHRARDEDGENHVERRDVQRRRRRRC